MGLATCWFMNTVEQEAGEVARGLRRRDPSLIDYLIQQYQYRLFRYLLMLTGSREQAEDLFQETWIRVLEKGHQYKERWKFETWLLPSLATWRSTSCGGGSRRAWMPCCNRLELTDPSNLQTRLHHPHLTRHSRVKKQPALPQR